MFAASGEAEERKGVARVTAIRRLVCHAPNGANRDAAWGVRVGSSDSLCPVSSILEEFCVFIYTCFSSAYIPFPLDGAHQPVREGN